MRVVSLGGSQAPLAAAWEVRPDPFPLGAGVLCVDLNGPVGFFGFIRVQLVDPVQRERPLQELGVPVSVVDELGRVGAHGGLDHGLFGRRN